MDTQKDETWDLNAMTPEQAEALCARTELEDYKFQRALVAAGADKGLEDDASTSDAQQGQTGTAASASKRKSTSKSRASSSSTSPEMRKRSRELFQYTESLLNLAMISSPRMTFWCLVWPCVDLLLRV